MNKLHGLSWLKGLSTLESVVCTYYSTVRVTDIANKLQGPEMCICGGVCSAQMVYFSLYKTS